MLDTWLIPAAILLVLGGALIGYLLSFRDELGRRNPDTLANA